MSAAEREPLDAWLRHIECPGQCDDCTACDACEYDCDAAELEANTFVTECGFVIEWYLSAVGQVSHVEFDTYAECAAWYEREGFQDFTS